MSETSLDTLRAYWGELHARLKAESADYRTMLALQSTMRSLERARPADRVEAHLVEKEKTAEAAEPAGSAIALALRVTRAQAVERILRVRGEPVPVDELMALMPAFGGPAGSRASLSSSLSQAPQFVSIRHRGRMCWWLVGRRVGADNASKARVTPASAARSSRWRQLPPRRAKQD
ncbi:hypothetical protein [Alsobacter sp. SYSU BS001988]